MKLQDIKKICKKCEARCCKMCGPNFTEKEMKRVLNVGHRDYFIKVKRDFYEVKSKNGRCPYLKKNFSCSIHKVRPLMCKCWPVYPEFKEKKRYVVIQCPLTPHLSKKQLELMKKKASKLRKDLIEAVETNLPKVETDILKKRLSKFKRKKLK